MQSQHHSSPLRSGETNLAICIDAIRDNYIRSSRQSEPQHRKAHSGTQPALPVPNYEAESQYTGWSYESRDEHSEEAEFGLWSSIIGAEGEALCYQILVRISAMDVFEGGKETDYEMTAQEEGYQGADEAGD
jgi:hypothetical protein